MASSSGGEAGLPVASAADHRTQDEIDQHWLEHVYKPHERQLTVRAVIMGGMLGAILSVANLYIGLKIGWSMGMAITSTILAFVFMKALEKARVVSTEFSMLENNTVASVASAAGYFSSAGMVSAIPALYLTTQRTLSFFELSLWMLGVSFVGIMMAVPMRRQMIDVERLRFPSGTACAETIRSMHTSAGEALAKGRALLYGMAFAAFVELPSQLVSVAGKKFPLFVGADFKLGGLAIAGKSLYSYTIALPSSALLYGAGAIMGIRVGLSMGIAAILLYGVITPWLDSHGVVTVVADNAGATYNSVLAWAVWPGVLGALAASLLQFGLKWRTVLSAFGSIGKIAKTGAASNRMSAVEVPPSWFLGGLAASTMLIAIAGLVIFEIELWMSLIAVALSFVLSIVACRSTGETDVTPIGALGKITQLSFAGIHPGNYYTNLMTASVTAGAAAHSADLLTDLKTGYLLGGSPRRQFVAQLFGILFGGLLCVPAYQILVGDGEKIGTQYPAPAAQTWAVFADLLSNGVDSADRGEAKVVPATVQTVNMGTRPAGMKVGDTLRIKTGPNAGDYTIAGIERRVLVLDRDLPTSEIPEAVGDTVESEVLSADGKSRGTAPLAAVPGERAGLRFVERAEGTRIGDYVKVSSGGKDLYHHIRAFRGDVAMLDHKFLVDTAEPVTVTVHKSTLPPYAGLAVIIAVLAGVVITLLEVYGPKTWRAYLPSMTAIGIAFVVRAYDSLAMTIGAVIAYVLVKTAPKFEDRYNVPFSSGIIAGASIMGLLLAVFTLLKWIET